MALKHQVTKNFNIGISYSFLFVSPAKFGQSKGTSTPKKKLVCEIESQICLRCLNKKVKDILPNGGLMVIYHGKKSP